MFARNIRKGADKITENKDKIILDLCGGTGSWSKPYKDAGYDVRVITLPKYDLMQTEFFGASHQSKTLSFLKDRNDMNPESYMLVDVENVFGIIAAPTCTQFSLARTTAKTPRDFESGMGLVQKCLEIIWFCRTHGNLKFWAIENPMGYLRQFLGKPALTFDPCDYGDTYTKKTDLWGYFNIPKQSKRKLTEEEVERCKVNKRVLPELPNGYVVPEGWGAQAARRSMTSKCFAQAFYEANK